MKFGGGSRALRTSKGSHHCSTSRSEADGFLFEAGLDLSFHLLLASGSGYCSGVSENDSHSRLKLR